MYRKLLVCSIVGCLTAQASAQIINLDTSSVEAQSWIILDPQSHQIIAEHNSDVPRAPASLTKMMVAYLTFNAIKAGKLHLDQIITTPDVVATVKPDESRLHLKPGDRISIQELLTALLVMSANDAALTLATLVGGDIPHFVAEMNTTAQKLGMKHTHFSNPSGITMDDHFASAHDLALLGQAITATTPEYLNYSKQQTFQYKDLFHNATNLLLKTDPSVDGLKTGYTEAAGYNFALTANRLDSNTNEYRRLIVVVMGTTNKFKRAEVADRLLNIAYTYTQTKRLFNHDQVIANIPVENGTVSHYQVHLPQNQSYSTVSLLPDTKLSINALNYDLTQHIYVADVASKTLLQPLAQPQGLQYSVKLNQSSINAPQNTSINLAEVTVAQNQQTINQIDVVDHVQVTEASWWHRAIHWIASLFGGLFHQTNKAVTFPIEVR